MVNPKVFSLFKTKNYAECFPNISVLGKKVDFFLECSSYDVILPVKVKGDSKLDVFEEAVLKLIAYKTTTSEDMADILCLTPDLINFIIIRLQEMDLLQDNGRDLTEQGKKYIRVDEKITDDANIEFAQAKVFVINQTGEILPYIQKGELISDPIENIQGSLLTVEYGTVGNPIRIKGKILRQNKGEKKKGMLQSSSLRSAIDKYNRIVRENVNYDSIEYAKEWAIENTSSDDIYFHMQAVVQDRNIDEILVSDGLVVNIDFVNDYIKRNHADFISVVKERATKNIIQESEDGTDEETKVTPNYKYRELRSLMSRINFFSQVYDCSDDEDESGNDAFASRDENQMLQAEQKKFLLNCYSAFEWSLFYYDTKHQMNSNVSSIIENQTAFQNSNTLLQMANRIGVVKPERYEELFYSLDSNRIKRMFRTNTPELRVALSLAIITSVHNSQCEFRELFNKRPNLFRVLHNLFREHGDLAHQTFTNEVDKRRNKEIHDLLIDFITILQPDYDIGESNEVKNRRVLSQISQDKLNAEVSLSKRLGALYYYNLLPYTIKEEWILVSPDKVHYPEAAEYFDILYRIMQDTLYYALKDIRKNPKLRKAEILSKLKERGVVSNSFDTVNEVFVAHIIMGENGTLGANAMVYLYYQKDNIFDELKNLNFVQIIEQLIQLRKHGNNVALSVNTQDLNKIRDNMFDIVKLIGGN